MDYLSPRRRKRFHKGRWQLARERCRIEVPVPPADDCEPRAVGEIVGTVMKKLGLPGREWEDVLLREWPRLAGDGVAAHTRPGRVDEGCLVVFVDSSVWLNELERYGRRQLLANVTSRVGVDKIRSVRFMLDPEGGRPGAIRAGG